MLKPEFRQRLPLQRVVADLPDSVVNREKVEHQNEENPPQEEEAPRHEVKAQHEVNAHDHEHVRVQVEVANIPSVL